MYDLYWKSYEFDTKIKCLGEMSSVFCLRASRMQLVFLHSHELTTLIVFSKQGDELVPSFAITLESELPVTQIAGNNNYILMYDINHVLHYLQIKSRGGTLALSSNNASTWLDKDSVLSWRRICEVKNCLAMIGVTDCFVFVYENDSIYSLIVDSNKVESGFTPDVLNYISESNSARYVFMEKLDNEIAAIITSKLFADYRSPYSDVLLIVYPGFIIFSRYMSDSQIFSKRFSVGLCPESVIAVMTFDKMGLLLIANRKGQIVSLQLRDSTDYINIGNIWLPGKIYTITGYEINHEIYLLWSDLYTFHLSKLADNGSQLIDLDYQTKNLSGIKYLIKIDDYALAFSIHVYFYKAKIEKLCRKNKKLSDSTILGKIHEVAKSTEKLNFNIAETEDVIRAIEFAETSTPVKVTVFVHGTSITMKNKTKYTFEKEIWRICLSSRNISQRVIEMRTFDNDFIPDAQISLFWCGINPTLLKVSLICDVVPDTLWVINLEVKVEESTMGNEDPHLTELKNLYL